MIKKIKGELEIQAHRGVIYFHSEETGGTVLRICQLDKDMCKRLCEGRGVIGQVQMDITHMRGASID